MSFASRPESRFSIISRAITTQVLISSFLAVASVALPRPALPREAPLASAAAELVSMPQKRIFDGTIEAVHQATVSAQTSGRIAEVRYDVDDFVAAGSVVVRFTNVEQQAGLQSAEAGLREAEARLTEAEEELRRARNLEQQGLGSQRDLDRATASREAAAAKVEASRSAVNSSRQQLEYTLVRAPYSGIVTARHVEVGEAVTTGQPLMSGLSLERLRVAVILPQRFAGKVRGAPRALVLTEPGQIEPEKITIFPVADPVSNTFTVRLELPPGNFGLYPGMFVKVAFLVSDSERLLVPSDAVVQRSEVSAVYVLTGDKARLRQVRTGEVFEDRVEILAGLHAGERVALDPVRAGIFTKRRQSDERQ